MPQHFHHPELLAPLAPLTSLTPFAPQSKPDYSDRAAYVMAEMSSLAYLPYEQNVDGLRAELAKTLQNRAIGLESVWDFR